jgi:hypothetical protein
MCLKTHHIFWSFPLCHNSIPLSISGYLVICLICHLPDFAGLLSDTNATRQNGISGEGGKGALGDNTPQP